MKHIKSYDQLTNESIFGDIGRMNPKRYDNDKRFLKLYQEIIDDFNKYNQDLRKVAIINDKGKTITSHEINIGDKATLTYIFGKYHPVSNNIYTANTRAGNRRIKISYIPFSITLKKNELERFFGTKKINKRKIRVIDEKIIDNPEYNPNIIRNLGAFDQPSESDRKKYNTIKDEYYVSADVAGKLLKAFIEEYKKQYPDIKGVYMNSMEISDVEAGIKPTLKHISVMSKDGKWLYMDLREGDDEKSIRNMLKNMTEEEYKKFSKKRDEKLYGEKRKKDDKRKKFETTKWKNKFTSLFEKYGIETCPYGGGEKSFDKFEPRYYGYSISVEFYVNKDISEKSLDDKIKEMSIKEDFEGYSFEYYIDQDFYKKTWYVRIMLEKDDN